MAVKYASYDKNSNHNIFRNSLLMSPVKLKYLGKYMLQLSYHAPNAVDTSNRQSSGSGSAYGGAHWT